MVLITLCVRGCASLALRTELPSQRLASNLYLLGRCKRKGGFLEVWLYLSYNMVVCTVSIVYVLWYIVQSLSWFDGGMYSVHSICANGTLYRVYPGLMSACTMFIVWGILDHRFVCTVSILYLCVLAIDPGGKSIMCTLYILYMRIFPLEGGGGY